VRQLPAWYGSILSAALISGSRDSRSGTSMNETGDAGCWMPASDCARGTGQPEQQHQRKKYSASRLQMPETYVLMSTHRMQACATIAESGRLIVEAGIRCVLFNRLDACLSVCLALILFTGTDDLPIAGFQIERILVGLGFFTFVPLIIWSILSY
jgi:hypothetical protein